MKFFKILFCLLVFTSFNIFSQLIEIPETIYFAGMQLNLSQGLREDLQKQVMEMTKNKSYFQNVVNRTDTYFPIIERVFAEEGLPTDFKYQVIQESKLQSDAVSTSNAVGFWQFKKESAIEVGVIVNDNVDERKHIVESTRGAARYLKKNYLILTNWIYALIAYQTGLGGIKQLVNSKYVGATEMNLEKETYWYAVKFLAHKIAYEDKVGYNKQPEICLLEYNINTKGKTLAEIAAIANIAEDKILLYNKWLSKTHIPNEKNHTVLLPVSYTERDAMAAKLGIELNQKVVLAAEVKEPIAVANLQHKIAEKNYDGIPLFVTYNALDAIQARMGDTPAKLAFAGEISPEKFFRYNDMQIFEDVIPGKIYYLEAKNNRGITLYHTVMAGENLWDVAQKYGLKIKQLMKKNRMDDGDALQEGRLLYLKYKRPENEPIVIAEKPKNLPVKIQEPIKPIAPAVALDVSKKNIITPKKDSISTNGQLNRMPTDTIKAFTPKNVIKDTTIIFKNTPKFYTKPNPISDSTYSYHLVAMQQTLYALSRYYGVKVDTLKNWNNLGNEGIKFDQKLIVNKIKKSLPNQYLLYAVKVNDDVNSIATNLGIMPENILLWNDKKNNTVLIGEMLKIKLSAIK